LTLWVNGDVTTVWESLEVLKGYVGLEAEGYRIEFRNLRLKELRRGEAAARPSGLRPK